MVFGSRNPSNKLNNFRYPSFKKSRALLRSVTTTKIVRAEHHQGDLGYGATPVCWNSFLSVTTWDGTDLDMTLEKGDQLFKSLNQYRLLGVDELPRTVSMYGHTVDIFY